MDILKILEELIQVKKKLDKAIRAIERLDKPPKSKRPKKKKPARKTKAVGRRGWA